MFQGPFKALPRKKPYYFACFLHQLTNRPLHDIRLAAEILQIAFSSDVERSHDAENFSLDVEGYVKALRVTAMMNDQLLTRE